MNKSVGAAERKAAEKLQPRGRRATNITEAVVMDGHSTKTCNKDNHEVYWPSMQLLASFSTELGRKQSNLQYQFY